METVKQTKEMKIFKKRNGRFAIKKADGKWINGEEKVKILSAEGLIKVSIPKKKEEPVEAAAEEAPAEVSAEAPTEETTES
ncbi:MAG: hypothetical protein KDD33_00380 [Bdellovibrionales bacterium]|nr:hypothetical protein [Bdellovibrionales bacterium]